MILVGYQCGIRNTTQPCNVDSCEFCDFNKLISFGLVFDQSLLVGSCHRGKQLQIKQRCLKAFQSEGGTSANSVTHRWWPGCTPRCQPNSGQRLFCPGWDLQCCRTQNDYLINWCYCVCVRDGWRDTKRGHAKRNRTLSLCKCVPQWIGVHLYTRGHWNVSAAALNERQKVQGRIFPLLSADVSGHNLCFVLSPLLKPEKYGVTCTERWEKGARGSECEGASKTISPFLLAVSVRLPGSRGPGVYGLQFV